MSAFIKCEDLLSLMKSRTSYFAHLESGDLKPGMRFPREPPRYSIFDVRPSKDFRISRIVHSKTNVLEMSLNIVPDAITPQTTGDSLESFIVRSTRDRRQRTLIRHRDTHHVDLIVLVDWGSREDTVTARSLLVSLKTILSRRDQGRCPPRHVILEGGFREWILRYPDFTTNSKATIPEDCTPDELSQLVEVSKHSKTISLTLPVYPIYDTSSPVDETVSRRTIVTNFLESLGELEQLLKEQKYLEQVSVTKTREILKMVEKGIDCPQSYGDEAHKLNDHLKNLVERIGEKEEEIKTMEKKGREKMHWMIDDRVKKEKMESDIRNLKKQIARLGKMKTNLTMEIINRPWPESFDTTEIDSAPEDPRLVPESAPSTSLSLTRPAPDRVQVQESPKVSFEETPMEVDIESPSDSPPRRPLSSTDDLKSADQRIPGTTGLENPNSYICYANSVIQCLSHISQIKNFFVDNFTNVEGHVTQVFHRVMKTLWSGQHKSFSIEVLREKVGERKPTFNNKNYQDAQEFLTELLQILHEELQEEQSPDDDGEGQSPQEAMNRVLEGKYSIISRTFYGQTRSFATCDTCGSTSSRKETAFDAFTTLIVSLPEVNDLTNSHDLKTCIDESLKGMEMRTCTRCGGVQPARVVQEFTQLPPVLIVALNRFMKTQGKNEIRKNETSVSYPLRMELEVSEAEVKTKVRYQLQGVCRHSGSLARGHYYSYCRHLMSQRWYRFNDSDVNYVRTTEVVAEKETAYVFFYLKSETV
ncbi:ubiquitin carboxyl-terminal hydrolase 8-like [Diachasmimorpha longicaudata]|uniref:ubiquitin carboxyl-terminal hydrolase 8-like n=1 Tax=Diachasmimorpha longicaudata TaxID=58733 RepID=UPI0030B91454